MKDLGLNPDGRNELPMSNGLNDSCWCFSSM